MHDNCRPLRILSNISIVYEGWLYNIFHDHFDRIFWQTIDTDVGLGKGVVHRGILFCSSSCIISHKNFWVHLTETSNLELSDYGFDKKLLHFVSVNLSEKSITAMYRGKHNRHYYHHVELVSRKQFWANTVNCRLFVRPTKEEVLDSCNS